MSASIIIASIIFLWLVTLSVFIFTLRKHYSSLTAHVSQKDLLSSLNHFISLCQENADNIDKLNEHLNSEVIANKKHLQKIGFNRYNPFTDTGGDQSFSLALLDEMGDGIVISSLHSRENTRLYAKNVVAGKVETQALSKEEQIVIKEALNK